MIYIRNLKLIYSSSRIRRRILRCCAHSQRTPRNLSTSSSFAIVAHVDAGKTTTTERLLFSCGAITRMGDVDDGSTVTDFMPDERERGITIKSASVRLKWRDYPAMTLLDTPGHVDFTAEVLHSLSVVDGVVVVLDSKAGVQAQTRMIWSMLGDMPRIVFLNKLDNRNASVENCMRHLKKLDRNRIPLLVTYMKPGTDRVVDVVQEHSPALELMNKMRHDLLDDLASVNDDFAQLILMDDKGYGNITADQIRETIGRHCSSRNKCKVYPVFSGSAQNNLGLRNLLDGVGDYLWTTGDDLANKYKLLDSEYRSVATAHVFKLMYDARLKKILTVLRVVSSKLKKGMSLSCVDGGGSRGRSLTVSRLFVPFAQQMEEVYELETGCVGAVLFSSPAGDLPKIGQVLSSRKQTIATTGHHDIPTDDSFEDEKIYCCSVEPDRGDQIRAMSAALDIMCVEDDSIEWQKNNDNVGSVGVLRTNGELQAEVILSRLKREFDVNVRTGPIQLIRYEFAIGGQVVLKDRDIRLRLKSEIAECQRLMPKKHRFHEVEVERSETWRDGVDVTDNQIAAVNAGIRSGLCHGPISGNEVVGISCALLDPLPAKLTGPNLSFSVSTMVRTAMSQWPTAFLELEPMTKVVVWLVGDEISELSREVVAELAGRRSGKVVLVDNSQGIVIVRCRVSKLDGFGSAVRSITHGLGSIVLESDGFDGFTC